MNPSFIALLNGIETAISSFHYSIRVAEMTYDFIKAKLTHHHTLDLSTVEGVRENRKKYWKEISADTGNELENHFNAFGYYDPIRKAVFLSDKSMYVALRYDLHLDEEHANLITSASISLGLLKNLEGVNFSFSTGIAGEIPAKAAAQLLHAHDSGFFDKGTGKFNLKRFSIVNEFAIKDRHGNLVISLDKYFAALRFLATNDTRWKDTGYVEAMIGKVGNTGEIGFLFDIVSSQWIDGLAYANVADIELFYRHTAKIFERIANGDLCLPPKLETKIPSSSATVTEAIPYTTPVKNDAFDKLLSAACRYANDVFENCPSYFNQNTPQQPQAGHARLFAINRTCHNAGYLAPPAAPLSLGR